MAKQKKTTRYDSPEYVPAIQAMFEEKFPDTVPSQFIIEYAVKYFWETLKTKLIEEEEVSITGLGKFTMTGKYNKFKNFQYYPRFKWSRHFVVHARAMKGTATEAELKEIKERRAFMAEVWNKRKAHMLKTRSKLPQSLANYIAHDYPQLREDTTSSSM